NPLKTVGRQSALAHESAAAPASDADPQSPERSASATSGTYVRAFRPSEQEVSRLARNDSEIDGAKLEGLRFELDVGVWRADSERIAQCVIADAAHVTETEAEAGRE